MVFWRRKTNNAEQDAQEQDLLHPQGEPELEPCTDDADAPAQDNVSTYHIDEAEDHALDEIQDYDAPKIIIADKDFAPVDLDNDHSDEGGWFSKMAKGLGKTTNKLTQGIGDVFTKSKLDQDMLDELEEVLLTADLGPKTAAKIIEEFSQDRFGKDISPEEVKEALSSVMQKMLEPVAKPLITPKPKAGPFVLLVCGVNGAGKTTTIGKFTQELRIKEGKTVMIAAADTFRAAAIEQLGVWAKRAGAEMFAKDVGTDAAAVAYEAYAKAKEQGTDVLIIDTAGRLQNKANLMAELEKIVRVLKKQDENVPHATLLVLDSTTGQNACSQLEIFKESVDVTGLIVTKLDGSAKGGVLVALADQYGVPVHAIGVGEGIEDLRPFSARDYARSLMGLDA